MLNYFISRKFISKPNKDVDLFYFKNKNCLHADLLTLKKKIITIT